jgi:hypothetical protein
MRFLVQLASLDLADGSTRQRAGDDLPAASSALEDDACADAVSVRF